MMRILTAQEQFEMLSPWRTAMPTYYHFTDDPHFSPDPHRRPADLYAEEGGAPVVSSPGMFVAPESHADEWAENFPGRRKVELYSPEDLNTTGDPDPFEIFVPGHKIHQLEVK